MRPGHAEHDAITLSTLPEDRPRAESQPCAACGTLLDPLRTERVLAHDDGYRYLCSEHCLLDFRNGARARLKRTPESLALRTPLTSPRAQLARLVPAAVPETTEQASQRGLAIGAAVASLAIALGFLGEHPLFSLAAAILGLTGAAIALWLSAATLTEIGWLGWVTGPAGAVLTTLAAHDAVLDGRGSWPSVVGAGCATAVVLTRAFLDRAGSTPVRSALSRLARGLPARARVPVPHGSDPFAMAVDQVDVATLRTGEELIARRGEVVAIDGVVQAGEARVLPFPGAGSPIKRGIGDSVLAGAQVVEGALRVLATRVGDDRALVRLSRIGTPLDRAPSHIAALAERLLRFAALVAIGLGMFAALFASGRAPALAAIGSVLLAAPVIALRRALSLPASAAAACAGVRGIAYHSGHALDTLGRASTVAIPPFGVLTERMPIVVECRAVDGTDENRLLGLCVAAQSIAAPHPIALAVERFAQAQKVAPIEVRRATYHEGLGVTAISPEGELLVVGSRRLLLQEGIGVASADAEAAAAEARGRVPVFVALGGRARAVLTLQYDLRVGARAAVQRMFDMRLEVVLLTGAHRSALKQLSEALDIEHVRADLLPEERGQQIHNLREAGGTVATIGRPGDDDAALAAADAGIVLTGAGGGAADRAVALVGDDVRDAAAALWIASAAREAMLRGLAVAAIGFGLVVAAAVAGLIEPGIAAAIALGIDVYCLPLGARLLRRIALRLPSRE